MCVRGQARRDQASPSTGRGNAPGTAEPHHRTRNRHHTRPRTAGEDGRPTCLATIGRARGVHAHQPPCDTVTSPRVPVSVRRIGRPGRRVTAGGHDADGSGGAPRHDAAAAGRTGDLRPAGLGLGRCGDRHLQDTVAVAGGEVLRVHSLAEESSANDPLGPFGDNDLVAVAIVRERLRPGSSDTVLDCHLNAVRVGAGQVGFDMVAAALAAVDVHGHAERSSRPADIAASAWCGVCRRTMDSLGRRGPLTRRGRPPAAPHRGLTTYVVTCPHVRRPRGRRTGERSLCRRFGRQAPGQAPWPGETHVRQLLLPPDNANGGHGRLPPVTPGTLAAVGG